MGRRSRHEVGPARGPRRTLAALAATALLVAACGSDETVTTRTTSTVATTVPATNPPTTAAPAPPTAGEGPMTYPTCPATTSAPNVLLVGSDERAPGDPGYGEVDGRRSDSLMLVRVDTVSGTVRVLGIPRDLLVRIADDGHRAKVNSAYARGIDRLARSLSSALGVCVDATIETTFRGLVDAVDALGGVTIGFASAQRDAFSGFTTDGGLDRLDGERALAYARSRHTEIFDGSTWRADPSGDLGRIRRQQELVRAGLAAISSRTGDDPSLVADLAARVSADVRLGGLSMPDVVRLALVALAVEPASIPMDVLPTVPGRAGSQSVVTLREAAAQPVLAPFRVGQG